MYSATAPRPRLLTRLMLVLGLLAALSPLTIAPAAASPSAVSVQAVSIQAETAPLALGAMSTRAVMADGVGTTDGTLPVNRWSGAVSSFHSRVSGGILDFTSVNNAVMRDFMAGNAMSTGGMMWSLTAGMVESATTTTVFDQLALRMDNAAGDILNAVLFGHPGQLAVAGALIIILLAGTFWKSIRGNGGGRPWRTLLQKALLLGVIFVMANGAASSNADAGTFGRFSPGWILNIVNQSISQVAAAPASAFMFGSDLLSATNVVPDDETAANCTTYRQTLRSNFEYATRGRGSASVSLVLNSIWEQSALSAWRNIQFGPDAASQQMAEFAYCHLLDSMAGIPTTASRVNITVGREDDSGADRVTNWGIDGLGARRPVLTSFLRRTGEFTGVGVPSAGTQAQHMSGSSLTRSASIFAWASCQPEGDSWTWRQFSLRGSEWGNTAWSPHRTDGDDDAWDANEHCNAFWTERDWDGHDSAWDFGSSTRNINARTSDDDPVRQFVSVTQGDSGSMNALALGTGHLISAASIAVVFVTLSGAVFLAKAAMAIMGLMLTVALVWSLLPGQSVGHRVGLIFKKFVGFSLLATGASLILSLVGLMTAMLTQILAAAFPPGGVAFTVVIGFAPMLALLAIHMLFTKVLKVASPMTPNGIKQWGKSAASMTTAAAAAGAGGFMGGKMGQRMKDRVTNNMSEATIGRVDKATGGMLSKMGATKHSSTKTAQRADGGVGGKHSGAEAMKGEARDDVKGGNTPAEAETIESASADAVDMGTAFKGGAKDTRRARRGFDMGARDADGKKLSAAEKRGIRDHAGHAAADANPREFAKWMADQHKGKDFSGWTPDQATDADYERFGKATLKENRKKRLDKTRADLADIKAQDAAKKAETLGPSTRRAVQSASKAAYANALAGDKSKKDAREAARAARVEEYKARGGFKKAMVSAAKEDLKHTPGGVAAAARAAKDPQVWKKTGSAVKGGLKVAAGAGLVSTGVGAAPGAYLIAKGAKQAVGGTMAERRKANDKKMAAYYAKKQAQTPSGAPAGGTAAPASPAPNQAPISTGHQTGAAAPREPVNPEQ